MSNETSKLVYPYQEHPPQGKTTEIEDGVLWLTMPMEGSLSHINLYLLKDLDGGWYVIDTGWNDEITMDLWNQIFDNTMGGKPVKGVICTHMHPDHTGSALAITNKFRCPLYMTQAEYYQARGFSGPSMDVGDNWRFHEFYYRAGMSEDALDQMQKMWAAQRKAGFSMPEMPPGYMRLRDGDTLRIGKSAWQVITGSGHSPEHACLYNPTLGIMISGDQILPIITSNVSIHPSEPEANPMHNWMLSHDKFMITPADTLILPAHNLPFYGVRDRLRDLVNHHEDRMLAIEEHCVDPCVSTDLLPVLFQRELDSRQTMMALGEAIAHVHLLMARNRIRRDLKQDGRYYYSSIDPDLQRRSHADNHDAPDDKPLMV
ncbi:MAG: MBL fold metallo-hydrolase [Pseudomonadales bacterium]|nr:MBL fold metallo-hydrolase [Pseudomonadales bacterium]